MDGETTEFRNVSSRLLSKGVYQNISFKISGFYAVWETDSIIVFYLHYLLKHSEVDDIPVKRGGPPDVGRRKKIVKPIYSLGIGPATRSSQSPHVRDKDDKKVIVIDSDDDADVIAKVKGEVKTEFR